MTSNEFASRRASTVTQSGPVIRATKASGPNMSMRQILSQTENSAENVGTVARNDFAVSFEAGSDGEVEEVKDDFAPEGDNAPMGTQNSTGKNEWDFD